MQNDYNYNNNYSPLSKSFENIKISPIFNNKLSLNSSNLNHHNGPLFINSNNSIFSKIGTNIMGKKLNIPDFNRKKAPIRPIRLSSHENENKSPLGVSIFNKKTDFTNSNNNSNSSLNNSLLETKKNNLSIIFQENLQRDNSMLNIPSYELGPNFNNISLDAPTGNNVFNNMSYMDGGGGAGDESSDVNHAYLNISNYNDLYYNFNIFDALINLDFVSFNICFNYFNSCSI